MSEEEIADLYNAVDTDYDFSSVGAGNTELIQHHAQLKKHKI